ncbi:MAG TPA: methyltransferase domain-containing protein, partial [Pseudomonadota bacterium]|nr:methyltransferase domain-containing protein [Pseudomonadota bacterium]
MSPLHPPDAEQAESHCLRAQQLWDQGLLAPARASFARAAFCDPGQRRYWRFLDHALAGTVADQISERLRRCLWDGIEDSRLDPAELPNVVYSFVCSQPTLQGWLQGRRAGTLATALAALRAREHDADPELCRMLRLVRVLGVEPELTLQSLRRLLLQDATSPGLPSPAMVQLAVALSHPCFASDYAWYHDADEDAWVGALRSELSNLREPTLRDERRWFQLAVLACYEPLSQLPQSDVLLAAAPHSQRADFTRLLRAQIAEPQIESALRSQIRQVGVIDDPVSLAVRAQYEASPFPRWQAQPNWLPGQGDRSQLRLLPALVQHPAPRILVAGCGTGKHPIATAMSYPQAEVLAIDLSLSSLAYAQRKSDELGLRNLRFVRADLLSCAELGMHFDAVESMGVLHHLADPRRGLRALLGVLKPQGWLRLGLYSATARRDITALRQQIATAAIEP